MQQRKPINVKPLPLEEVKRGAATTDQSNQLLSLEETTMDSLRTPDLVTEDRICNKQELDSLGLFSYAFCIICQEVIMPEAKVPVVCSLCQSAVYCKGCITQWQSRRRECCYCKQTRAGQFVNALTRPELLKVFQLTKIRCQHYPNCLEIHSLETIEKHEKISCSVRPCNQCNRSLQTGKVSMQAHIELHCEETKMPCQFCKTILTRRELMKSHKCNAVYPRSSFAITKAIVVNSHIIPNDFSAVTECFFCDNFLRNAVQCQSCLISCCESCANAGQGKTMTLNCPNKNCQVSGKFQQISRMAMNLLSKLQIKCPTCEQLVMYGSYDEHQLQHTFCEYCSKLLPNWNEIRKHYYSTCVKYTIHCENCEFHFPRVDYIQHDCIRHYDLRKLELVLFALTCVCQGYAIGFLKFLDLDHCYTWGGIRQFIITLMPNGIFIFWATSMMMNYMTTQIASKDLKQIHTEQRNLYLALAVCAGAFVLINNLTMKYNKDTWCSNENFDFALEHSQSGAFYTIVHWLLSFLNVVCYLASLVICGTLGNIYERRKRNLIRLKLKKA